MNPKNRIRELRKKIKFPASKLAKKVGISTQYMYDLEKCDRRLTAALLISFADIFDVSIDYLLYRTNHE